MYAKHMMETLSYGQEQWDEYFMSIARAVGTNSKCLSRKINTKYGEFVFSVSIDTMRLDIDVLAEKLRVSEQKMAKMLTVVEQAKKDAEKANFAKRRDLAVGLRPLFVHHHLDRIDPGCSPCRIKRTEKAAPYRYPNSSSSPACTKFECEMKLMRDQISRNQRKYKTRDDAKHSDKERLALDRADDVAGRCTQRF